MPSGVGGSYRVSLLRFNSLVYTTGAADNVSYAYPNITAGSLRQLRNAYSNASTSFLVLDTSVPVTVQFDGKFFDPLFTAVTYGLPPAVGTYPCTLVGPQSSATTITCITTAGSQGNNLVFQVVVAGQAARGTDLISFPVISSLLPPLSSCCLTHFDLLLWCFGASCQVSPAITRVSGCQDSGNSTLNCPTTGGTILTLYGYLSFPFLSTPL
jgi:hypothetical protein